MTTRVRAGGIASNTISNAMLKDDSVDSDIIANSIMANHNAIGGNDPSNYRLGKVIVDYYANSTSTTSSTMSELTTSSNYTGFTGGSSLEFFMHYPARNDTEDWSGGYIEPQLSFDNGSNYYGLGTCGYDGGIMLKNGYAILCYNNAYFIANSTSRIPSTDYSLKIKWNFSVYSGGTYKINGSHDINGRATNYIDTSATINRYQHYMHWIIKEWIPV